MLNSCEQVEPMLSAYMDGELEGSERDAVSKHLSECANCRRELNELRGVVAASAELSAPQVDDEIWDAFLGGVYNRLERRLGWTLFVLGTLMVAGLFVYEAVVVPWAEPWVKVVFATPFAGLGILFISVLRQRLHVARSDRYSRDVRH